MRTCNECGEAKTLSDYYHYKGKPHGKKCKPCINAAVKKNRAANIEHYRAYDRSRGNRLPPEYLAEYREKYPQKYKAKNMVGNAVRDKKLFRAPCEICGSEDSVHAHHNDYAKPLNVRWLCASHHRQWHCANGEGING